MAESFPGNIYKRMTKINIRKYTVQIYIVKIMRSIATRYEQSGPCPVNKYT